MRKYRSLCLVLALSGLLLAGCGHKAPDESPTASECPTETETETETQTETETESETESMTETEGRKEPETTEYLVRTDWSAEVKQGLTDFIRTYGTDSPNYRENTYAVFDFDNTTSIFDVEEQCCIYQLKHMAFAFSPSEIRGVLLSGLSNPGEDLTALNYGRGSYNDWASDIENAYSYLYSAYGPFTAEGLPEEAAGRIQNDPMWTEFFVKMRRLYDLVFAHEESAAACAWVTYWYTGMTPDEVYRMAGKSHECYGQVLTNRYTVYSPEIASRVGQVICIYTDGIQVTENIKELMKALSEHGIHVWVCSASQRDVIRAAVDAFGLHDYVDGVLGLCEKQGADGRYLSSYDFESGVGFVRDGAGWKADTYPMKAIPEQNGKTETVENALVSRYGTGPVAGFMDSKGDFNFCTEFSSLKLVLCLNRASKGITDGGGLISEIAVYQHDVLDYDLQKANAAGDTLYLLQGRQENGLRTFRNSRKTVRFGSETEELFAGPDNETQYAFMASSGMSTGQLINLFAVRTGKENSIIGIPFGFLTEYAGYHSK